MNIEQVSTALANKPVIGGVTAVGTPVVSFMDVLTPYLEFSMLVLGLVIAILTIVGLVKKNILTK